MRTSDITVAVSGRGPASDQGIDQHLAFLVIEDIAVALRAEQIGEDGPQSGDGRTAVLGHGDKLGVGRQPRAGAAREVRIDSIANKGDRTL